ncbi:MAG: hypothetical protein CM1200mP18_04340 [Gammaproteobacteria bacterium]|nr:MAG: hypothetical protein CM1200mP18_04340 [Gammaproteobacteria bacterium]
MCRTEEHVSVDLLDIWFPDRLDQCTTNNSKPSNGNHHDGSNLACLDQCYPNGRIRDTTEFLAIPYAPITFFISIMSGIAAISFAVNILHYAKNQGPMSPNTVETTN